jgi:RNA polymerase sigma factor (sigma-70 family)
VADGRNAGAADGRRRRARARSDAADGHRREAARLSGDPAAELENAYGDITLDALKRSFASVMELARFVHEGLRHDALDIAKSAAFRNTSSLTEMIASTDSPEHRVLEHEARDLLHEFLAELSEDDRKIAYLHFDPGYDWTPRRIAAALDLPRSEVKRTLDRVGIRLRRFAALTIAPGALCSHRRPELVQWQQTGVMPLSLRLHLRHCHRCRSEQRQAIVAVRSAILPLVPVATMPAAATGALARIYHAAGAHPSVVRSHDVIARVRKAAPVGGGGGAAIAVRGRARLPASSSPPCWSTRVRASTQPFEPTSCRAPSSGGAP